MKLIAKSVSVLITLGLVACGGGDEKKVAYRPISFGENNQCYYVDNPAEAQMLAEQGLCERHWAPTVMPVYWHQMYYPYYASPAYYNRYVPVATRTTYATSQKTWGQQNKTAIAQKAKGATYKASDGKTVTAEKIGATKYGAGNRFGSPGTKFGGGARDASTPKPAPPAPGIPSSESKTTATSPTVSPKAPAPKAPAPKSPSVKPPSKAPSGGSKSHGGGSRGGGYSGGGSRGGGSYGGGKR